MLTAWQSWLRLTAIRDQLERLFDEAAREKLTLREAMAFLCKREIARREHRRIDMASKACPRARPEDRALPGGARAGRLRLYGAALGQPTADP